ncbi:MAG: RING finger domain-containing protein [Promethearchaeota archaeon]
MEIVKKTRYNIMPSCIVCHLNIDKSTDSIYKCENGHPVHKYCLAEWLMHSQNCPLCNNPYSQSLIDQFQDYIEKKEKEKQSALEKELQKESIKKMEQVAEKIVFLKLVESIEELIDKKKYNEAIDKLLAEYNESAIDDKNLNVLFLLGKANYLKGRYDLTINFLFKLVKIRYDYPDGFLYLGKSYEKLGLHDKAKWAFERVSESK